MATARDLLTQAMKDAGIIGATQTPDAGDLNDAFVALNQWVTDLDTQRATIFQVARVLVPLTTGVDVLTIGPGGDIDVLRPQRIEAAGIVADPGGAYPAERAISVLNDAEFRAIVVRSVRGLPNAVYYDHAFITTGLGRIMPLPVPDQGGYTLVLYLPRAMHTFHDLSTDYVFPSGFQRAIRHALTAELADMFGRELSPRLAERARNALVNLKRANHRPAILRVDGHATRGYSIYTDR